LQNEIIIEGKLLTYLFLKIKDFVEPRWHAACRDFSQSYEDGFR